MALNALHRVTVKTSDLKPPAISTATFSGSGRLRPDLDFPGCWLYCGDGPVGQLLPRANAIGGGPSHDTGSFDHFAFLATDVAAIKATLEKKGVKYRENHIASPAIDQLFFPDNNNVMVELNFPR